VRRGMALEKGRVIVFSDAHFWPDDTTTAFKALIKFIEHFKPSAIVCNGDAFDGSGGISRFPRIGWQKTPTVKEEIEACQFYLGEIEKVANGAQLIWCMGNHDARLTNYIAANAPQLEGLPHTELKDFFPLWKPCWSFWVNEDTVIKHRLKGGRYAGYNNVNATLGCNIITGHTHVLCTSPISAYGKTAWGVQTGTLAEPTSMQFANYTEDAPHDWRSGFVMLSWERGRMLMPEMIQVCGENEVEFRGEILEV